MTDANHTVISILDYSANFYYKKRHKYRNMTTGRIFR